MSEAVSYTPGTWFAVVGPGAVVLLPPSEKARAGSLWSLVDDGAGFDEVLDALVSAGLRSLPGFVLVAREDATTKVVVRGPTTATFETADGPVEVDGSESATWVEKRLEGVSGMVVRVEDGEAGPYALTGGLVRVASLRTPAEVGAPAGGGAYAGDGAHGDAEPAPAAAEQRDEEPVEPSAPFVPLVKMPAAQQAAAEPAQDPAPQPAQDPAPQPEHAPQPEAAPEPAAPQPVVAPPPPPGPPAPPAPPAPAPAESPWGAPPAPPAPPEPQQAPGAVDHDGLTRAGVPSPELARQQPGIPGQPSAPKVTAFPVARLEFSSGDRIDVDRVVLVGRAPEAGRFTQAEQPLMVTVPSPNQEISSTHCEIRPGTGVDHGAAVVTDLGSTNGTVLVQPGLGPEELRPGVPVQLIPGAVIDLGDGLTIRVTSP